MANNCKLVIKNKGRQSFEIKDSTDLLTVINSILQSSQIKTGDRLIQITYSEFPDEKQFEIEKKAVAADLGMDVSALELISLKKLKTNKDYAKKINTALYKLNEASNINLVIDIYNSISASMRRAKALKDFKFNSAANENEKRIIEEEYQNKVASLLARYRVYHANSGYHFREKAKKLIDKYEIVDKTDTVLVSIPFMQIFNAGANETQSKSDKYFPYFPGMIGPIISTPKEKAKNALIKIALIDRIKASNIRRFAVYGNKTLDNKIKVNKSGDVFLLEFKPEITEQQIQSYLEEQANASELNVNRSDGNLIDLSLFNIIKNEKDETGKDFWKVNQEDGTIIGLYNFNSEKIGDKNTHKQVVTLNNQEILLGPVHQEVLNLSAIDFNDIVLEVGNTVATVINDDFVQDNINAKVESANAFITPTHFKALSKNFDNENPGVDEFVLFENNKFYDLGGNEIPVYTDELGVGILLDSKTKVPGSVPNLYKVKRIVDSIVTKGFNTDLDILFKDKKSGKVIAEIPGYTYYKVTKKNATQIQGLFNTDGSVNENFVVEFLNANHTIEANGELKYYLTRIGLGKETYIPMGLLKYILTPQNKIDVTLEEMTELTRIYNSVVNDFINKLKIYSFAKQNLKRSSVAGEDIFIARKQETGVSKFAETIELKDKDGNPLMDLTPTYFLSGYEKNTPKTLDHEDSPHYITYIKNGIEVKEALLFVMTDNRGNHLPQFSADAMRALILLVEGNENFNKVMNYEQKTLIQKVTALINDKNRLKTKKSVRIRNGAFTILNGNPVVNLDESANNEQGFGNIKLVFTNIVPKRLETPIEKSEFKQTIRKFITKSEITDKDSPELKAFNVIATAINKFQLDLIEKYVTKNQIEDFLENRINQSVFFGALANNSMIKSKDKNKIKTGLNLLKQAYDNNEVYKFGEEEVSMKLTIKSAIQDFKNSLVDIAQEQVSVRPTAKRIKLKSGYNLKLDLTFPETTINNSVYKLEGGNFYFPLELSVNMSETGGINFFFTAYSSDTDAPFFSRKGADGSTQVFSFDRNSNNTLGPIEFDIKFSSLESLNQESLNDEQFIKELTKKIVASLSDKVQQRIIQNFSEQNENSELIQEVEEFAKQIKQKMFNPETQTKSTFMYDLDIKDPSKITAESNMVEASKAVSNINRNNITIGTRFKWKPGINVENLSTETVDEEVVSPLDVEPITPEDIAEAFGSIKEETQSESKEEKDVPPSNIQNDDIDNAFGDIDFNEEDFQFYEERAELGKPVTQQQVEKEILKVFPYFVRGEVVDDIAKQLNILGLNGTPLGVARGLALYLNRIADTHVLHHEIMHVVFDNFMTDEEQNFALEEMKKKYGLNFNAIQKMLDRRNYDLVATSKEAIELYLQELLADEYASWKNRSKTQKISDFLKNIFRRILRFLNLSVKHNIEDKFRDIENGKYKNVRFTDVRISDKVNFSILKTNKKEFLDKNTTNMVYKYLKLFKENVGRKFEKDDVFITLQNAEKQLAIQLKGLTFAKNEFTEIIDVHEAIKTLITLKAENESVYNTNADLIVKEIQDSEDVLGEFTFEDEGFNPNDEAPKEKYDQSPLTRNPTNFSRLARIFLKTLHTKKEVGKLTFLNVKKILIDQLEISNAKQVANAKEEDKLVVQEKGQRIIDNLKSIKSESDFNKIYANTAIEKLKNTIVDAKTRVLKIDEFIDDNLVYNGLLKLLSGKEISDFWPIINFYADLLPANTKNNVAINPLKAFRDAMREQFFEQNEVNGEWSMTPTKQISLYNAVMKGFKKEKTEYLNTRVEKEREKETDEIAKTGKRVRTYIATEANQVKKLLNGFIKNEVKLNDADFEVINEKVKTKLQNAVLASKENLIPLKQTLSELMEMFAENGIQLPSYYVYYSILQTYRTKGFNSEIKNEVEKELSYFDTNKVYIDFESNDFLEIYKNVNRKKDIAKGSVSIIKEKISKILYDSSYFNMEEALLSVKDAENNSRWTIVETGFIFKETRRIANQIKKGLLPMLNGIVPSNFGIYQSNFLQINNDTIQFDEFNGQEFFTDFLGKYSERFLHEFEYIDEIGKLQKGFRETMMYSLGQLEASKTNMNVPLIVRDFVTDIEVNGNKEYKISYEAFEEITKLIQWELERIKDVIASPKGTIKNFNDKKLETFEDWAKQFTTKDNTGKLVFQDNPKYRGYGFFLNHFLPSDVKISLVKQIYDRKQKGEDLSTSINLSGIRSQINNVLETYIKNYVNEAVDKISQYEGVKKLKLIGSQIIINSTEVNAKVKDNEVRIEKTQSFPAYIANELINYWVHVTPLHIELFGDPAKSFKDPIVDFVKRLKSVNALGKSFDAYTVATMPDRIIYVDMRIDEEYADNTGIKRSNRTPYTEEGLVELYKKEYPQIDENSTQLATTEQLAEQKTIPTFNEWKDSNFSAIESTDGQSKHSPIHRLDMTRTLTRYNDENINYQIYTLSGGFLWSKKITKEKFESLSEEEKVDIVLGEKDRSGETTYHQIVQFNTDLHLSQLSAIHKKMKSGGAANGSMKTVTTGKVDSDNLSGFVYHKMSDYLIFRSQVSQLKNEGFAYEAQKLLTKIFKLWQKSNPNDRYSDEGIGDRQEFQNLFSQLHKLYKPIYGQEREYAKLKLMETKGIDQIVPYSASKGVTSSVAPTLKVKDTAVDFDKIDINDITSDVFNNVEVAIHTMPAGLKYFQHEVPVNKEAIVFGTQRLQQIRREQNLDAEVSYPDGKGGYTLVKVGDVLKSYEISLAKNFLNEHNEIMAEFKNPDGTLKQEAIVQRLSESFTRDDISLNLREMYSPNGDRFAGRPDLPNNLYVFADAFVSNFASNYQLKVYGDAFALVSDDSYIPIRNKEGKIIPLNIVSKMSEQELVETERSLLSSYWDNETGQLVYEVVIPAANKHEYELFLNGQIDLETFEDRAWKMFGFRIPTQEKHSMGILKVVDLLDPTYGSVMIVSAAKMLEDGHDKDIDKMFTQKTKYYTSKAKNEPIKRIIYGDWAYALLNNNFESAEERAEFIETGIKELIDWAKASPGVRSLYKKKLAEIIERQLEDAEVTETTKRLIILKQAAKEKGISTRLPLEELERKVFRAYVNEKLKDKEFLKKLQLDAANKFGDFTIESFNEFYEEYEAIYKSILDKTNSEVNAAFKDAKKRNLPVTKNELQKTLLTENLKNSEEYQSKLNILIPLTKLVKYEMLGTMVSFDMILESDPDIMAKRLSREFQYQQQAIVETIDALFHSNKVTKLSDIVADENNNYVNVTNDEILSIVDYKWRKENEILEHTFHLLSNSGVYDLQRIPATTDSALAIKKVNDIQYAQGFNAHFNSPLRRQEQFANNLGSKMNTGIFASGNRYHSNLMSYEAEIINDYSPKIRIYIDGQFIVEEFSNFSESLDGIKASYDNIKDALTKIYKSKLSNSNLADKSFNYPDGYTRAADFLSTLTSVATDGSKLDTTKSLNFTFEVASLYNTMAIFGVPDILVYTLLNHPSVRKIAEYSGEEFNTEVRNKVRDVEKSLSEMDPKEQSKYLSIMDENDLFSDEDDIYAEYKILSFIVQFINLGFPFSKFNGFNKFIDGISSDQILDPTYIYELLKPFTDSRVVEIDENGKSVIIPPLLEALYENADKIIYGNNKDSFRNDPVRLKQFYEICNKINSTPSSYVTIFTENSYLKRIADPFTAIQIVTMLESIIPSFNKMTIKNTIIGTQADKNLPLLMKQAEKLEHIKIASIYSILNGVLKGEMNDFENDLDRANIFLDNEQNLKNANISKNLNLTDLEKVILYYYLKSVGNEYNSFIRHLTLEKSGVNAGKLFLNTQLNITPAYKNAITVDAIKLMEKKVLLNNADEEQTYVGKKLIRYILEKEIRETGMIMKYGSLMNSIPFPSFDIFTQGINNEETEFIYNITSPKSDVLSSPALNQIILKSLLSASKKDTTGLIKYEFDKNLYDDLGNVIITESDYFDSSRNLTRGFKNNGTHYMIPHYFSVRNQKTYTNSDYEAEYVSYYDSDKKELVTFPVSDVYYIPKNVNTFILFKEIKNNTFNDPYKTFIQSSSFGRIYAPFDKFGINEKSNNTNYLDFNLEENYFTFTNTSEEDEVRNQIVDNLLKLNEGNKIKIGKGRYIISKIDQYFNENNEQITYYHVTPLTKIKREGKEPINIDATNNPLFRKKNIEAEQELGQVLSEASIISKINDEYKKANDKLSQISALLNSARVRLGKKTVSNHAMRYEMVSYNNIYKIDTTTLSLAQQGKRTSTTRTYLLGNVGDVISFENKRDLYIITKTFQITPEQFKDEEFLNEWSQKEGWTKNYLQGKFKSKINKGVFVTEYRKLSPAEAVKYDVFDNELTEEETNKINQLTKENQNILTEIKAVLLSKGLSEQEIGEGNFIRIQNEANKIYKAWVENKKQDVITARKNKFYKDLITSIKETQNKILNSGTFGLEYSEKWLDYMYENYPYLFEPQPIPAYDYEDQTQILTGNIFNQGSEQKSTLNNAAAFFGKKETPVTSEATSSTQPNKIVKGVEVKPGIFVNQNAQVIQPGLELYKQALTKEEQKLFYEFGKSVLEKHGYNPFPQYVMASAGEMEWSPEFVVSKTGEGYERPGDYNKKIISHKKKVKGSDGAKGSRWTYHYYLSNLDGSKIMPIPNNIIEILEKISGQDMSDYDTVLINLYPIGRTLGWHVDVSEDYRNLDRDIISVSIGADADFYYANTPDDFISGDPEKAGYEVKNLNLKSGDVITFGGESRLISHTVKNVKGTTDLGLIDLSNSNVNKGFSGGLKLNNWRMNFTFRVADPNNNKSKRLKKDKNIKANSLSIANSAVKKEPYWKKDEAMANASTKAIAAPLKSKTSYVSSSNAYVEVLKGKDVLNKDFNENDSVWVFGNLDNYGGITKENNESNFAKRYKPVIDEAVAAGVKVFNVGIASGIDTLTSNYLKSLGFKSESQSGWNKWVAPTKVETVENIILPTKGDDVINDIINMYKAVTDLNIDYTPDELQTKLTEAYVKASSLVSQDILKNKVLPAVKDSIVKAKDKADLPSENKVNQAFTTTDKKEDCNNNAV